MKWGRRQNWINERLPSASHSFHRHLHEHFWSPHFDNALDEDWITQLYPDNDLPHPVVQTASEYLCENSTYDCSMDETVLIAQPSRWLARKMGLCLNGRRGDWLDAAGQLTAYDPSTRERGHGAL